MLQAENTLFTITLIGYFALTALNFAFVILKNPAEYIILKLKSQHPAVIFGRYNYLGIRIYDKNAYVVNTAYSLDFDEKIIGIHIPLRKAVIHTAVSCPEYTLLI